MTATPARPRGSGPGPTANARRGGAQAAGRIALALRRRLPDLSVDESRDVVVLDSIATGLRLELAPGRVGLRLPAWTDGPDAGAAVARLADVVTVVERETGLVGWDPQVEAPFLRSFGEGHPERLPLAAAAPGAAEDDAVFLRRFLSGELGREDFTHESHLRVAHELLRRHAPEEALRRMREGLLAFIAHHGIDPAKYCEVTTRRWIDRLAATRAADGRSTDFRAFLAAHPELLERTPRPDPGRGC
ncbi:MAG: hypothetical protein R3F20_16320 [Planctomycetota bacterium]